MPNQTSLNFTSRPSGPVECLGHSFPSDEARREHYLGLLAEKLKDPEFRKIEGFPIGEDEDILALSDPPYYTACPNPWIGEFIAHYGHPYDPKEKYHREPFAADVSEGKNHPIYNAHSYHTKVPHRAIMRYILHYTEPGDLVFDGFCGTGMTGVAAQLCGDRGEIQELGYKIRNDDKVFDEGGVSISKRGIRNSILSDLSPIATLISEALNRSLDSDEFFKHAELAVKKTEALLGDLYTTIHNGWKVRDRKLVIHKRYDRRDSEVGEVEFTVFSDVLACPTCAAQHSYYEIAVDEVEDRLRASCKCPSCGDDLQESDWKPVIETVFDLALGRTIRRNKIVPVLINYSVGSTRFEKVPDEADIKRMNEASEMVKSHGFPPVELIPGKETGRNRPIGITHLHHFFTPVEHIYSASLLQEILRIADADIRRGLVLSFTAMLPYASRMRRFRADRKGGGPLSGTLYVSSLITPLNVRETFLRNVKSIAQGLSAPLRSKLNRVVSTQSATSLTNIGSDSVDYLFIDPPFGYNFDYSELNFFWEGVIRVVTCQAPEAIISSSQQKGLLDYATLMRSAFKEFYRILKPGNWMTVEFSNTQASIWNGIQTALQEAGFVVANVSGLDRKQMSFKAVTTTTAVKQDLVISAYKPNGGLEDRFRKSGHSIDGVWDFLKTHLRNLPVVKPRGGELEFIAERDPRILYDRMVAFYVGHSVPVPLSSAEFQASVAEKFPEREGMFFLPEQVAEFDKKRAQMEGVGQMSIFVEDEKSAIDWLRNFLKTRPSTYQDIQPEFMQQLGASWKKFETRPELRLLLEQNFLQFRDEGEVPSQIHSYLSTQNKDLRNLPKDDGKLKSRAKDRWYVPDPAKAVDVEAIRDKRLRQEFWELCDEVGIARRQAGDANQRTLPLPVSAGKTKGKKKLKEVRSEAVRLGFKECFATQDYATILNLAAQLPDNVIEEDEQLQMIRDMAEMRAES